MVPKVSKTIIRFLRAVDGIPEGAVGITFNFHTVWIPHDYFSYIGIPVHGMPVVERLTGNYIITDSCPVWEKNIEDCLTEDEKQRLQVLEDVWLKNYDDRGNYKTKI
jgi:hypothetical protein